MKTKFYLLLCLVALCNTLCAYAGDHPEANFGIYGIQHHNLLAEYQQYVGQVVKYIPSNHGKGSYDDEKQFLGAGGKFNTEYVITKISGNDKRMMFTLTEKGTKNKVKMVVNNQFEYYSFGKYTYCITESYTIPLLLSGKLEADRALYIGKVYQSKADTSVEIEISDILIHETTDSYKSYPKICYVLKDRTDDKMYYYDVANTEDLNMIGTVYSNPKFACKYTIVCVENKKSDYYPYEIEKHYLVKNSIDGKIKSIPASSAGVSAFKGDDSGKFFAELTKVEKPSNSTVRYGKTTSVTEKDITKYSYEDNFIDILIFATNTQFNFVLKNVSDNTQKVVWNEAVFVDVDGSTSKIMHSGIKYSQREGDQPASTIIKGAKLEDLAAPTVKVYYSDILKEWTSMSLYSNAKTDLEGQIIKLMLPIQVKDVVNEYIFEFTLTYIFDHPEYLADKN